MMILSIMMRPALMLSGFVTAMLLTQPVTGLVNAKFMSSMTHIQADSTTGLVSFIAYLAIYVLMMTTVLHTVFSLIHWIPDNLPRRISGHVGGDPASPDQKEKEAIVACRDNSWSLLRQSRVHNPQPTSLRRPAQPIAVERSQPDFFTKAGESRLTH